MSSLTLPLKATEPAIHQEQPLYLIGFSFPFGLDPDTLFIWTAWQPSPIFLLLFQLLQCVQNKWWIRTQISFVFQIKPNSAVQFTSCLTPVPWLTPHPYLRHMSTTRLTEDSSSVANLLPVIHPIPHEGLASVFQIHSPFCVLRNHYWYLPPLLSLTENPKEKKYHWDTKSSHLRYLLLSVPPFCQAWLSSHFPNHSTLMTGWHLPITLDKPSRVRLYCPLQQSPLPISP